MKLALDVYYYENKAKVVGLLFQDWEDKEPFQIIERYTYDIEEYEPGNFYKRELPCILDILETINLSEIDVIIVDSYVFLDDTGRKGLGAYLYEYLDPKIDVIGVAKKYFHNNNAIEVLRGKSANPLYVTSIGLNPNVAAESIKKMDGKFRMPTLLKLLDQQTRIE